MARPYQHRSTPRVPAKVDDIQVNFCRNSRCTNFGVPPKLTVKKGRNSQDRDGYRLVGGRKITTLKQSMTCLLCNESFTVQSNRAIVEERDRLLAPFLTVSTAQCPRAACESRLLNVVDHPKAYIRFGSTHSGSPRYRCKRCGATFSVPARSTLRQRLPQKSPLIFSLLINKSPMRRICEVAGIRPEMLYQRIDFFHRQCVKVAQTHERLLLAGKSFDRLHIAVDRQDHTLNWGSHLDRRNVVLRAIASADSRSGYVFGVHLNYDPAMDPQETELMARERGDFDVGLPFREFARIWLASQYHAHPSSEETPSPSKRDVKLPSLGMQVHEEYTQFGHFLYLERLLRGAKRLQFSLDQEPSIRAACLVAFQERAIARTLDAFVGG
jgi:transposase-like protein